MRHSMVEHCGSLKAAIDVPLVTRNCPRRGLAGRRTVHLCHGAPLHVVYTRLHGRRVHGLPVGGWKWRGRARSIVDRTQGTPDQTTTSGELCAPAAGKPWRRA